MAKKLKNEWHPTKNGDLKFEDISKGSSRKVWWLCSKTCEQGCLHEWQTDMRCRLKYGQGCPFCANKQICYHQSIKYKYPELMIEWNYNKNIEMNPEDYGEGSSKKVWWICQNKCEFGCLHEYQQVIRKKINYNQGCPYCSIPAHKICYHNSLEYKYPEIAKKWHPTKNGELKPNEISYNSGTKVWFLCPNPCKYGCVHEYEVQIYQHIKDKSGCPYCSKISKYMCYHDSLEFKYPLIAKEWHPTKNEKLKASDVMCGSSKKVWWICSEKNHEWSAIINDRIYNNQGCPCCVNKTECMLYENLKKKYPNYIIHKPKSFEWCCSETSGKKYPYDIYIEDIKTIIELDGEQHFKQVLNWGSPEETIKRDIFKMKKAIENGMRVIRLSRTLFVKKNIDMYEILYKHIEGNDQIIFSGELGVYNNHKAQLYKN